jgi:hypothetical protein
LPPACRRWSAVSVQSRRTVCTAKYSRASRLSQLRRRHVLTLHLHVSSLQSIMRFCQVRITWSWCGCTLSYANMTEKQPCVFELSTYSVINASGSGFVNTIVRDNCKTAQLFCDTTSQLCERLRLVGERCQFHRDCQSVCFHVFRQSLSAEHNE